MTVCWHVNDLKVSHVDENAVTAFALKLAKIYGPKTTISCGKVHEYLGFDINCSVMGCKRSSASECSFFKRT